MIGISVWVKGRSTATEQAASAEAVGVRARRKRREGEASDGGAGAQRRERGGGWLTGPAWQRGNGALGGGPTRQKNKGARVRGKVMPPMRGPRTSVGGRDEVVSGGRADRAGPPVSERKKGRGSAVADGEAPLAVRG